MSNFSEIHKLNIFNKVYENQSRLSILYNTEQKKEKVNKIIKNLKPNFTLSNKIIKFGQIHDCDACHRKIKSSNTNIYIYNNKILNFGRICYKKINNIKPNNNHNHKLTNNHINNTDIDEIDEFNEIADITDSLIIYCTKEYHNLMKNDNYSYIILTKFYYEISNMNEDLKFPLFGNFLNNIKKIIFQKEHDIYNIENIKNENYICYYCNIILSKDDIQHLKEQNLTNSVRAVCKKHFKKNDLFEATTFFNSDELKKKKKNLKIIFLKKNLKKNNLFKKKKFLKNKK